MEDLQGQFLIATPSLLDPNFRQAVVLIVQHGEEGAMGLVVNRQTHTSIREAWEQVSDTPCPHDQPLHIGGPCQESLAALHGGSATDGLTVMPGLHCVMAAEQLESLIESGLEPVRFFVGYAGWAPGQLEAELKGGSWLVSPARPADIFGDVDNLWDHITRRLAGSFLQVPHLPEDPSLN